MSNNQSITLDGSNVVYATEIIKANETGNTTLNETIIEVAGDGNITQQDVNDSIAPLQTELSILNTKQLQNFNGISSINTDSTNNYQTNSQLNGNFYNKAEIDATFVNYYTSTQIDTNLSTNYQNNTLLATNYYNKGEVDTLIAGAGGSGGYTDTEIDNLLDLRVPKSDFTDRFSTFPVIDCSAPTVIHSGLTLNNSTINISPTTGLLFSNQFGGGDKIVSVFKNATNYITLQGNKIISNATSDDSIVDLNLNPSGNVNITNDLSVGNIDLTSNLTVGGEIQLTDTNTSIERYNNAVKLNVSMDVRTDQEALRLMLGASTDADTNTFIECNNSTGGATLFKPTYFKDTVNYENDTSNISNASGLTLYKNTTDASNVLTVKNAQGYITFNSFNINAYNTSNDSSSLLLLNTANGNGCYCLSLGIGAIAGGNKLNVAGSSNFGGTTAFQNTSTFNNNIHVNSSGRLFQRADANNSLNIISTNEINFSLQSNRSTDPTTSSIALQLNDNPAGITMNRAVTNNLTFNSIGNIVGEADIISWGRFMFQNSSEFKEVLDTQYKLYIRNSDALGDINLTVGLEASTPEIQLTDGKVNLLGHLDVTHTDVSGSQRVFIDNPDDNGMIRFSNNGLSRLDITTTGVDVFGVFTTSNNATIAGNLTCVALTETSDAKLKENIKEINTTECYKAVKYIKPKTYNFINDESKRSNLGMIADDIKDAQLPPEWDNIIYYNDDGIKLLAYNKLTVVLWGCMQELMKEVEDLKKEVKKLKGKGKGERKIINKSYYIMKKYYICKCGLKRPTHETLEENINHINTKIHLNYVEKRYNKNPEFWNKVYEKNAKKLEEIKQFSKQKST